MIQSVIIFVGFFGACFLEISTELKIHFHPDDYERILWKSLNLTWDIFLMVPDFSLSDVSWKLLAKSLDSSSTEFLGWVDLSGAL